MVEFKKLPTAVRSFGISSLVWFDPRVVARISVEDLHQANEFSGLSVTFLPFALWPAPQAGVELVQFEKGKIVVSRGENLAAPTKTTLWVNPSSVCAIEQNEAITKLHFLPSVGLEFDLTTSEIVVFPTDERGKFRPETPELVAHSLGISLS